MTPCPSPPAGGRGYAPDPISKKNFPKKRKNPEIGFLPFLFF
jgi:hypothetical protein